MGDDQDVEAPGQAPLDSSGTWACVRATIGEPFLEAGYFTQKQPAELGWRCENISNTTEVARTAYYVTKGLAELMRTFGA